MTYTAVIDANINRLAEALRVLEDYARFIRQDKTLTLSLADWRHKIRLHPSNRPDNTQCRDSAADQRHNDPPPARADSIAVLRANSSRATEAARVLEEYTGDALFTACRYAVYTLEKHLLEPLIRPGIPRGIYCISDNPAALLTGIQQGAVMVQLRNKTGSKTDSLNTAQDLISLMKAQAIQIPLIINDYIDIALTVQAAGLHTGQDDLPLPVIRARVGPTMILGRTCHSLEQALAAQAAGADYVSLGPIYETPSKPGRPATGVSILKNTSGLHIPFVAIGGINTRTIHAILPYKPPLVGIIRDYANTTVLKRYLDHPLDAAS